jgi:putative ATP-dependent endonuclease of OLD family
MGHNDTQLNQGDYKFLERFLDATKANLFFARGVIIVEGDAENILIPTIAEIIGTPLHGYGVSIVNVGSTAYKRYAKIFLRQDKDDEKYKNEWLDIPVSIISDKDENDGGKIEDIKNQWNKQNVRIFISKIKTLEYELLASDLKEYFIKSVLIAYKIKNSKDEHYYDKLSDENGSFKIPEEIITQYNDIQNLEAETHYNDYFTDKNVSKAITAEIFCEILKQNKSIAREAFIDKSEDNSLKYLADAIHHAANPIF